jgi:Family of unknown function (DUF6307)
MTATVEYLSLHDQRVKLVQGALKQNSKLSDKASLDLAVHVLAALDYMPEKLR